MSYNRRNDILERFWLDEEDYDLLYCDLCRDLIRKNLYNPVDP